MDKKEILFSKLFRKDKQNGYHVIHENDALSVMDEYARQQAIEFGNKLRYGLLNNQQNLLIPTEQLYDLFLKQQQNVP